MGGDLADAADLIELGDLVGEWGDHQVDPAAQLLDLGGELVDASQQQLADEPVMVLEVSGQRLLQLADLGAHGAAGHLGQHLGVRCPAIIAWSICRPETPEYVRDRGRQRDLGVFEELLQPLLLAGLLPDQGAPVAGQVPELADRFGWPEAGPAHAALDHLGPPHRVQLVGLGPAGHVLDVLGVEQPAREAFGSSRENAGFQ